MKRNPSNLKCYICPRVNSLVKIKLLSQSLNGSRQLLHICLTYKGPISSSFWSWYGTTLRLVTFNFKIKCPYFLLIVFNAYSLSKSKLSSQLNYIAPNQKFFLVNMKRLHPRIRITFTFLRDFFVRFYTPPHLFRCGISDRHGMYHHESSLAHFEKSSLNYL